MIRPLFNNPKAIQRLSIAVALLMSPLGIQAQDYKAYLVSDAHFDTQWNWDVQRSISEYIPKTMETNIMLLQKYPDYVFNFEGAVKYSWMKEYYPQLYEYVKKYVAEGRWHVTGSFWDATDINIPAPESVTRNILYGQNFYRSEFGTESTDVFLPDCFGFGWQLPTVAAHSGLIGFSTQKLQWRHKPFYGNSKIPFKIGLWQGVDGSRIMLVADAGNYTTRWPDTDLSHNEELLNLAKNSPIHAAYHYYGTGDTGGSPTIESVRAVEKGVKGSGPVKIISATSDQLYKDFQPFSSHPELPVFNGELLMDVHGTGCYTSQAAMKLFNRRNEQLGYAAEASSVAADWLKALPYQKNALTESWKRFIWHGFHDDLTGTSIPRAYEFSWNDELLSMKQFANVMSSSVGAVSRSLDTRVKGTPLVVFNPSAFDAANIVTVKIPNAKGRLAIFDPDGKMVPTQTSTDSDGAICLTAELAAPSLGYAVYDVRKQSSNKQASELKVGDRTLENACYKVTLDDNGDIASILDKRSGKQLVEQGKSIRLALFTEDRSVDWPAWEIKKSEIDKQPVSITDNVRIEIAERGPARVSLSVERSYKDSHFKQIISLNSGAQADRIDISNEVDWATTNALLKAEFPLTTGAPKATYDLGVGTVERGNNTDTAYEVYAHDWADLTDKSQDYGVTIMNNCKYGWDKPSDHVIRLTLLHTPSTADNFSYQSRQDFGKHFFTYSIMGHKGDMTHSEMSRKAQVLNYSLYAFTTLRHSGSLGKKFSLGSCDNGNVLLKAVKQAENGDEYIVRFYETQGKDAQNASFTFCAPIASAQEVNGMEDKIGAAQVSGNKLSFSIKPYSIKSFKVRLNAPKQTVASSLQVPLTIPYDHCATTYNAFRRTNNFDGKGNSFAAELFPAQVVCKGVSFRLAGADTLNAMKCKGQTLTLPAGRHNRIYLLATSTAKDHRAKIVVDGKEQWVEVPSYSEFVGQWGHTGHTEGYIKPADVAFVGTHKHSMVGNKDVPYSFTYMFSVPVTVTDKTRSITLPNDSRMVVFAATALQDDNNAGIEPATDMLRVKIPERTASQQTVSRKNLLLNKPVIERSGQVKNENAELAVDDNPETKWCDTGQEKTKYIAFDLGRQEEIKGWYVLSAGLEELDYITKEYGIQVKNSLDEEWKTVDNVRENTELETDRLLSSPVKARYVRLVITKPEQSEGHVARIYEFSVY